MGSLIDRRRNEGESGIGTGAYTRRCLQLLAEILSRQEPWGRSLKRTPPNLSTITPAAGKTLFAPFLLDGRTTAFDAKVPGSNSLDRSWFQRGALGFRNLTSRLQILLQGASNGIRHRPDTLFSKTYIARSSNSTQ